MIKNQHINPDCIAPNQYFSFLQSYTLSPNQQQIIACGKAIVNGASEETITAVCSAINFDPIIAKWIGELMALRSVPFNYLVPNIVA